MTDEIERPDDLTPKTPNTPESAGGMSLATVDYFRMWDTPVECAFICVHLRNLRLKGYLGFST